MCQYRIARFWWCMHNVLPLPVWGELTDCRKMSLMTSVKYWHDLSADAVLAVTIKITLSGVYSWKQNVHAARFPANLCNTKYAWGSAAALQVMSIATCTDKIVCAPQRRRVCVYDGRDYAGLKSLLSVLATILVWHCMYVDQGNPMTLQK